MAKQLVMILSNEGFLDGVEELSQNSKKHRNVFYVFLYPLKIKQQKQNLML